ncbi:hypothetical protein [Aquimarina rubra]|uniref:DoxX family membrane protein n=1 Tax=Aquimarina rubra TaxID=1920033 RepID=A0ABW5LCT0_9FLAO
MDLLIGYAIRLITFPGLILKAFINKLICNMLGLQVQKVNYLALDEHVLSVEHEKPRSYTYVLAMVLIPFLEMSLLAMVLFNMGKYLIPNSEIIFLWLGISVATHSFPESDVGHLLFKKSLKQIKDGNYLAAFNLPLALLIQISTKPYFFWLHLLYGTLLYFLVVFQMNI